MFEHLGPALVILRQHTGATQAEVAKAAQITRPMLSSYENGKSQPSMDVLARLLEALDATLGELHACLLAAMQATQAPTVHMRDFRPHLEAALRAFNVHHDTREEIEFHRAVASIVRWMVHIRGELIVTQTDAATEIPS